MERNPVLRSVREGERGHAIAGVGSLIAAAGAVLLMIGAAGDTDWLTIVGGIVLAVGIVAAGLLHHATVDYDMYARLEKLEGGGGKG
jgi:hypothetical protein